MAEVAVDRARTAASGAQTLAIVAFWFITLTLAVNYGVATIRTLVEMRGASFAETVRALAPSYVSILPAIFFLDALSRLRHALGEYEAGRFFSPRAAKAVRRAGELAVIGMLAKIVAAPTLIAWIRQEGGLDFNFELIDLALVAILAFVAMVGRVLDLAVAVKAENDQII